VFKCPVHGGEKIERGKEGRRNRNEEDGKMMGFS
jgi:predicted RNA-binding Zn-ribbon protein involved in translation (DUF1610 family)